MRKQTPGENIYYKCVVTNNTHNETKSKKLEVLQSPMNEKKHLLHVLQDWVLMLDAHDRDFCAMFSDL